MVKGTTRIINWHVCLCMCTRLLHSCPRGMLPI